MNDFADLAWSRICLVPFCIGVLFRKIRGANAFSRLNIPCLDDPIYIKCFSSLLHDA
jgi:hypothetical protein